MSAFGKNIKENGAKIMNKSKPLDRAKKRTAQNDKNERFYKMMNDVLTVYERAQYLTAPREYDISLQELEIFLSYFVEENLMKGNP